MKITIMFRGREVFHPELGSRILDAVAEQVAPVGKVETHARLDGRNMTMVLAPDKRAQAAPRRNDHRRSDGSAAAPSSTASTAGSTPTVDAATRHEG